MLVPRRKNFDAMALTIKEEEGLEGCFKVDKRADGNWTFSVRDAFFVFGFGDYRALAVSPAPKLAASLFLPHTHARARYT